MWSEFRPVPFIDKTGSEVDGHGIGTLRTEDWELFPNLTVPEEADRTPCQMTPAEAIVRLSFPISDNRMKEEAMTQLNDHEKGHVQPVSFHGDTPFLAMFAERRDNWTLIGSYDEGSDVWVADGQPLVTSHNVALETVTFTRSGGESQDRD